jgi:hypothetical protein
VIKKYFVAWNVVLPLANSLDVMFQLCWLIICMLVKCLMHFSRYTFFFTSNVLLLASTNYNVDSVFFNLYMFRQWKLWEKMSCPTKSLFCMVELRYTFIPIFANLSPFAYTWIVIIVLCEGLSILLLLWLYNLALSDCSCARIFKILLWDLWSYAT